MSAIIHLSDIRKSYFMGGQEIPVLKGISLDIFKNEYVALMGSSGAGKSTLMNILGCLDTPTSGQYILNEQDVSKMQDDALADVRNNEIGFVFQQFNLLPRLTAAENVALPLVYAGVPKKERLERAMVALEKVGLGSRHDHKANQMSGGHISVSPLRVRLSIIQRFYWQTNRPETSIPKHLLRSWKSLARYKLLAIPLYWSRTRTTSQHTPKESSVCVTV